MLRHIVLIKSEVPEKVQAILKAMVYIPDILPGLLRYEYGSDINGRTLGYDNIFIMDFKDKDALQAWVEHPKHIPIRKALRSFGELLIFDYEFDNATA